MTATYEPGTVAVATVRSAPNVRVIRLESLWYSALPVDGERAHVLEDVTDVRPLGVLDLSAECIPSEAAIRHLRANGHSGCICTAIADQIEAQTKPPRIPEPGWGQRVLATVKGTDRPRQQYVNAYQYTGGGIEHGMWVWTAADGFKAAWSDLVDPVLVRNDPEVGAS